MTDPTEDPKGDDTFKELQEIVVQSPNTPIAPATGIAAIALNMALKYHDINTVQDGVLYQQYKMEGRNLQSLHLDHVFDTAIRMEAHLLGADKRIANLIINALEIAVEDDEEPKGEPEPPA